eukprot:g2455.t1
MLTGLRSSVFRRRIPVNINHKVSTLTRFYSTVQDADIKRFEEILRDDGSENAEGSIGDGAQSVAGKNPGVITDASELERYNTDWLKQYHGSSQLVLRPRTTEQVSAILAHCHTNNLAVCPQGGNTGLVGGSVPTNDEIVLNLERMNSILDFNPVSGILTCEAGCILQNLDEFLTSQPDPAHQHCMPLDLGAKGNCQIGGNVATNAGGLRYIRYGSLQGTVLGMEVVLADGTVLDLLSTLRKDNTGYHLKHLFIGSEGTLGVITKLSILCPRKSNAINVAFLACPDYNAVQKTFQTAKKDLGEILSACEFMDSSSIQTVREEFPEIPAPDFTKEEDSNFFMLIETRGSNMNHDQEKVMGFLETVMESGDVLDGVMAQDEKQSAQLWRLREDIPLAVVQRGVTLKYDVSLPIEKLYSPVEAFRERFAQSTEYQDTGKKDPLCVGYGHLGDGNLHLNITQVHDTNRKVDPHVKDVIEPYVYEFIRESRGSVSAEHGLGQQKRNCIHYSKSSESIELMQDIKALFDRKGILNPNKVLPKDERTG